MHKSPYLFAFAWNEWEYGFTNDDEHADEQGDESSWAEGCAHAEGCGVTGLDDSMGVAATHMDGKCASGAKSWRPTIHNQDGQQVQVLLLSVETRSLGPNACCVVCKRREG